MRIEDADRRYRQAKFWLHGPPLLCHQGGVTALCRTTERDRATGLLRRGREGWPDRAYTSHAITACDGGDLGCVEDTKRPAAQLQFHFAFLCDYVC